MDLSPFPYQGPLEPGQLLARTDLVADLLQRVTERRVTALLGPRRFGKTSALREVESTLSAIGNSVVWLDLYELSSWSDLAYRLDGALTSGGATGNRHFADVAASLQLRLGVVHVELRKPERQRPDPALLVQDQLGVLATVAERSSTVLIIDEFSGIARVDGAAGLLRTKLQHSYQHLGLLFAGSEPSTMQMLFTDQAQPFYGQADLVEIEALSDAEIHAVVTAGFDATGRGAGNLAARIAAFTDGHPQRVMQLADACWRATPHETDADDRVWAIAVDAVRSATASGFERLYSSFETSEKLVLRVVAQGGSLFGRDAEFLDLSRGGAQHARQTLLDRGHLQLRDGRPAIVDPVFADWIESRFR